MGGGRVQVVVELLDVFPVVPFGGGQAEKTFFQDRIPAVPKGQTEAEPGFPIAEAEEAILPPAIDPGTRMVMREVVPARTMLRVVLANRAPLAFGQVRPEELPVFFGGRLSLKAFVFGGGPKPQDVGS